MAVAVPTFDLVVRNGTLADGTGNPLYESDVGVVDGRIAAIGRGLGAGREEIDARDLLVTPGFVDIHTHYDGQATWDSRLTPSCWHGVTTAVMGNCGVGFAPVRPQDHDQLISVIEGVEDIPDSVVAESLRWDWEGFPGYLHVRERRPHDIEFAAQLPHAAMRIFVMDKRVERMEAATLDDIVRMREIAREAITADARGFSTSHTLNYRTKSGDPITSLRAAEAELLGILRVLEDARAGVFELISDFDFSGPVRGPSGAW